MGSQRVGYNLATKPPPWTFYLTFSLPPLLCWSSRALACYLLRWLAIWIKSLFLATVHLLIMGLSCDEQTGLGSGNTGLSPLTCGNAGIHDRAPSASFICHQTMWLGGRGRRVQVCLGPPSPWGSGKGPRGHLLDMSPWDRHSALRVLLRGLKIEWI